MAKGLTSKRSEDYPSWYNEVVKKADLAENSAVRGCMIIKPYGYTIWEKMQQILDGKFKDTGHLNAYFPLFIPKSFLSKEAKHVEGFAKECAVVTHYRLKNSDDGKEVIVDPEAKLEEELIVRPTSETVIWGAYKNWIQSYRDLPLLINQWANVVRWEMRTRLFLRTSEFLWQEGHTAHATKDEATVEAQKMLDVYAEFCEKTLAMPVIKGYKTESEKFAGAEITYCIEALMQDGKALQAGTSHFLGQNFAKAFDVKFANQEGKEEYVWGTSWGVTTRLMGALIMTHSDDSGLVLPPMLAPFQVVIVPIFKEENKKEVIDYASEIGNQLRLLGVRVKEDFSAMQKPGWKFAQHELRGVPLRIAVGGRDLENKTFEISIRHNLSKENYQLSQLEQIPELLKDIQKKMFEKAKDFRDKKITKADSFEALEQLLDSHKGFVAAHWDGTAESEEYIKQKTKATIRCIPIDNPKEEGLCIVSGKPSKERVLIAKAY